MSSDRLNLLVALPAEAKPLIRAFDLKRLQPDGTFPCYGRGALTLVLSGPGRAAAGSAVAYMRDLSADSHSHWINLGIAGHARLRPGDCLLADSVLDATTGEHWLLTPMAGLPGVDVGPLRCVPHAETRYAQTAAYDMESAAIARVLDRVHALSRLQVLKVVSDNPHNPSRRINAKMVGELIEGCLPTLDALMRRLQSHAQSC
jgi:nucleoside phosphorylase